MASTFLPVLLSYLNFKAQSKIQSNRKCQLTEEKEQSIIARSSRKGHFVNNRGLLVIVKQFCTNLGTKVQYQSVGHDSDFTEMTFHRVQGFRIEHLTLVFGRKLSVLPFMLPY